MGCIRRQCGENDKRNQQSLHRNSSSISAGAIECLNPPPRNPRSPARGSENRVVESDILSGPLDCARAVNRYLSRIENNYARTCNDRAAVGAAGALG